MVELIAKLHGSGVREKEGRKRRKEERRREGEREGHKVRITDDLNPQMVLVWLQSAHRGSGPPKPGLSLKFKEKVRQDHVCDRS